jgi:predicted transcriptional regulator
MPVKLVVRKGRPMSEVLESAGLTNSAVAEYAERVGAHHKIYASSGSADIAQLVAALGGRVETSSALLAPEALTVHERGRFTIHLPALTSDRRDRFTIAHELGHYFLHYLLPGETGEKKFGRGSQNRPETEANIFAASLLMPAQAYQRAFEEHGNDWWQLGEVFGVSPRSAEVRAEVLGLRLA